jgi:pre-mRNA-splicing factor 18
MNNAVIRDYTTANDKYIELSIGNAPWPMGVCMLGITVKRNAQRLAHILNDEMSRKWTQAIKRLLTISQ